MLLTAVSIHVLIDLGWTNNPPDHTLGSGEGGEEMLAQKVPITQDDGEPEGSEGATQDDGEPEGSEGATQDDGEPEGSEGALTPPNQPVPEQVLVTGVEPGVAEAEGSPPNPDQKPRKRARGPDRLKDGLSTSRHFSLEPGAELGRRKTPRRL